MTSVHGSYCAINNLSIVEALRNSGYEVTTHPHGWYHVFPEIHAGITLLKGIPIAKDGLRVISLSSFASVCGYIDFLKAFRFPTSTSLTQLEQIRILIHNAALLTKSDFNVYVELQRNLEYVTSEVIALNCRPAKLPEGYSPQQTVTVPFRKINEACDIWRNEIPEKVSFDKRLEVKYDHSTWPLADRRDIGVIRETLADYLADDIDEVLRKGAALADYAEEIKAEREDTIPGGEYIKKAASFEGMEDKAAAANNMLTAYNNAIYEELLSAADRIEKMINELGYTLVRGFDDTDPAQVVKTL